MKLKDCSPEQLQDARDYAAELYEQLAVECFNDDFGFASHITQADKEVYAQTKIKQADAIKAGERDHNLTIAQRMHFFLRGESIPLLGYSK
jgi:hypothetical protein